MLTCVPVYAMLPVCGSSPGGQRHGACLFFLSFFQKLKWRLEDADAPAGSVNLKKSIFKPLVPVGDTDVEDEKPKAPEPVTVAEPIKAKVDDDEDADFKELQEKMAAAKKKKSD